MEVSERWQADRISASTGSITVSGLTLDELVQRENVTRIDFLKMNIEGAEIKALAGMETTLRMTQAPSISCHDFLATGNDREYFRTKGRIEAAVKQAGFQVMSRAADPRPYIADQVNAIRQ